jgi:CHAT domain-containing protein
MSLRQLQAAMPPRVVLIEYAVSDTVSHAWIVTPHSRTFSSIPAGRQELAQLVLAATPPQADSGARAHLSRLLLEDAMPALAASDELVVIPDGPLVALPFGFLAGRDDRPLAGHLSIVLTPSAQSWRQATIRLAAHHRSSTSLLAIGNPRLDARVYPVLPDLPQADAEIAAVATHYAAPRLLLRGPSATVDAVVRGLATADVVHVAAHAVMNPWLTDASYIALAGPESPTLTASRVRTLGRLPARLVVLAACESGAGGRALFDSPLSLARAFLAAGVPAVVASLWPVSDRASRALFDVFHTEFSRSGDAARALQRAQVALMGSTDSSLSDARQWAGFVAMGGSAMKGTSGGGME